MPQFSEHNVHALVDALKHVAFTLMAVEKFKVNLQVLHTKSLFDYLMTQMVISQ